MNKAIKRLSSTYL